MRQDIEETLATLQSSVNLLAGLISQHAERLAMIEWRQEWEVEAWRKDAGEGAYEAARDAARNAEGLRSFDLGVTE